MNRDTLELTLGAMRETAENERRQGTAVHSLLVNTARATDSTIRASLEIAAGEVLRHSESIAAALEINAHVIERLYNQRQSLILALARSMVGTLGNDDLLDELSEEMSAAVRTAIRETGGREALVNGDACPF